jgi:glycosyltransferase involved in cell wall biosynthesis
MNLNFIGPVCGDATSYSICTQNIVTELSKLCNISLFPIGKAQQFPLGQYPEMVNALNNGMLNFDHTADCVRLYHAFSQDMFVGTGLHLAFPIFELNDFNEIEKHHLSSVDDIFVTSEWAKQIVLDTINTTWVHVAPLGVDTTIFKPCSRQANDATVFTHIGKAEIRKSSCDIVDCFNAAFTEEDDVILYLSWQNRFYEDMPDWNTYAKESPLGHKIQLVPPDIPVAELVKLYQATDCLVSMSKAEGWNMPLLEAMACGCNVIATDCTAQTEFCTNDNCLLIEVDEMEIAYDGHFFKGKCGEWHCVGERQHEQLIEYMRAVHTTRPADVELNVAGIETAKKFSWANTAAAIMEVFEE